MEETELEQLIKKHEEYGVQIDRQLSKSQAVKDEGRRLVVGGHFMSHEVKAADSQTGSSAEKLSITSILTSSLYSRVICPGGGACL